MAQITADMVKELRERTGVGMMECKKALVTAHGDIEKAIEEMRKSGIAKAAKKAGRTAAEGAVMIAANAHKAVMVEINSETDFVARDSNFIGFCDKVIHQALKHNVTDVASLAALTIDGMSIDEARHTLIAKIGENINVRRIAVLQSAGHLGSYRHGDRIGVLVAMEGGDAELARDVAMHIAASKPEVVTPEEVSQESINKEKEIFASQALESGKPAQIVEKMIEGRIKKFLSEVSLVGQPFVKDPNITVGQLLQNKKATVTAFIRFEVGEGIEKQTADFAAEVMAQVKGL